MKMDLMNIPHDTLTAWSFWMLASLFGVCLGLLINQRKLKDVIVGHKKKYIKTKTHKSTKKTLHKTIKKKPVIQLKKDPFAELKKNE